MLRVHIVLVEESLEKICGISKLILRTFGNENFRIIKSRPSGNQRGQYFEKINEKLSGSSI